LSIIDLFIARNDYFKNGTSFFIAIVLPEKNVLSNSCSGNNTFVLQGGSKGTGVHLSRMAFFFVVLSGYRSFHFIKTSPHQIKYSST
jgi:hypothetical protein